MKISPKVHRNLWWCLSEREENAKVLGVHPLGTVNVCTNLFSYAFLFYSGPKCWEQQARRHPYKSTNRANAGMQIQRPGSTCSELVPLPTQCSTKTLLNVQPSDGPTWHEQSAVITLWEGLSCEEKHTIKSQAAVSDQTFTQPTALSCQRGFQLVLHWSECLHSGNRPRAGYVCCTHPCNCNV